MLAFDKECFKWLKLLKYKNIIIISLREFEYPELKEIKKNRTRTEYCWTCTPSLIEHCLNKYKIKECTYLDADIFFYSDPEIILEELREKSVLITEHRYTREYDQTKLSGIYCVQFMTFKNDLLGRKALEWWRLSCNKWCYNRCEDGKFGDQKYLDDWPIRFKGIHSLKNLGGGVAPWNIQQYSFEKKGKKYNWHV